jgi:hypothetical protein
VEKAKIKKNKGVKTAENKKVKKEKKVSKIGRVGKVVGEFIGLAITLVFLYKVFPNLTFITSEYNFWLPIATMTAIVGSFLKVIKHIVGINFLERVLEIGSLSASIYSMYKLYEIFPVDLSVVGYGQFNQYLRFAFLASIFAIGIAIIVNFVKIFISEKD